jgi:hypothetical protein
LQEEETPSQEEYVRVNHINVFDYDNQFEAS